MAYSCILFLQLFIIYHQTLVFIKKLYEKVSVKSEFGEVVLTFGKDEKWMADTTKNEIVALLKLSDIGDSNV